MKTTLSPADKRTFARLLKSPRLAAVRDAFAETARLSRQWDDLVSASLAEFGDTKRTPISGIYADHFPETRKVELRTLARAIATASDHAWSLRPRYVRTDTTRNVRLAVIARDGSGFYG